MNVRLRARAPTPLGWLAVAWAVALLLATAGRGVGLRWDPFGFEQRKLAAIVACDAARRLAVETLTAERAMQDRLQDQKPARRWRGPL